MASTLKNQLHNWRKDRDIRDNFLYLDMPSFLGNLKPGMWFVPVSCVKSAGPFVLLAIEVRLFTSTGTVTYNCASVSTGKMFYFTPKQKVKIIKGKWEGNKDA